MAAESLIFMPNGDLTLTLIRNVFNEEDSPPGTLALQQTTTNKDRQTAAAREVEARAHTEPKEPDDPDEDVLFFAPEPPESDYFEPPPPRATRGSNASSRRDRSASPPASFWASLKRQAAGMTEPINEEDTTILPRPARKPERIVVSSHEVHCVVSSRHMMLASKYFERMLSGDSNEAVTLRNHGKVSIPLSGDLDAMIILLNIVHGVSRKVPRQVNLEVLSKLAVLVSIFEMLDAVQFFSDTWIDNFQRIGLPESYNENVLPLLFIFWVFERPSEFKDMTRLAQRECDEKVDEDAKEVPIPHKIIDAINRDREFAMESAITIIHTLINRYLEGRTICDGALDEEHGYACDAMVLGSLLKSSRKIGIWPKPEAPFHGRKFKDLARAIRSIKILDVCKKTSSRRLHMLGPSTNCHSLEDSIASSMKSIEGGMDGLELFDYSKESDDFSFGFQMLLPLPSNDATSEQPKEDTRKSSPIYEKADKKQTPEQEDNVPQSEYAIPQATLPTSTDSRNLEESLQKDMKLVSARQYSTDTQQQAWVPETSSIKEVKEPVSEERKASPRNFQNQETRTTPIIIAKVVEPPLTGEVKALVEKNLNRTTSFPKIPTDEVKPLAKESYQASRVVSSEAAVKKASLAEKPGKDEVTQSTVEVRLAPGDAFTATEDEEAVVLPFSKMRKSKKRFSAKY